MFAKPGSNEAEVNKYSTLSIVWAVIAGASFVALDWVPDFNKTGAPLVKGAAYTISVAQNGFKVVNGSSSLLNDPLSLTIFLLILLIPVAIITALLTALFARVRTKVPGLGIMRLHTFTGIIGLLGTISILVPSIIHDTKTLQPYITALVLIPITSFVSWIQKPFRNLFNSRPALASVFLLAIGYATVWLANQATLLNIILTQVGVWLALISFAVIVYSGLHMQRSSRKANKR